MDRELNKLQGTKKSKFLNVFWLEIFVKINACATPKLIQQPKLVAKLVNAWLKKQNIWKREREVQILSVEMN